MSVRMTYYCTTKNYLTLLETIVLFSMDNLKLYVTIQKSEFVFLSDINCKKSTNHNA